MSRHQRDSHSGRVPHPVTWIMLTTAVLTHVAIAQDNPSASAIPAQAATGQPAMSSSARKALTREDLNQALVVFDELDEQIQIAAAKLDPQSLARKEQIGKLRSLLRATDEQVQLQSTTIGRLEERFRHLRQDLSGVGGGQGTAVSPEATALLEKSRTPIEDAKARLERLANHRARTRQRLAALQQAHVQALLAAIVAPSEPASRADDFERLLETRLNEAAR